MSLKFAFAGFRHGHIFSLLNRLKELPGCEIVAACEEDKESREALIKKNAVKITHTSIDKMLADVDCDVIAVGDYYGKRGSILIKALTAGKHVIADKPVCTSLAELDTIEKLAKKSKLRIGCQLDLRSQPNMVGIRKLVQRGMLGDIHGISFGGQHPLLSGSRPGWYFEEGKHGGTINDIAIHGIDIIEWITGMEITHLNAARSWNAFSKDKPHFEDAAQFMLSMENGCGILGDVSYFAPDSCGYATPFYWDFKFWGTKGVATANIVENTFKVAFNGDKGVSVMAQPADVGPDYLAQFIDEINGKPGALNTQSIIAVSRKTLKIQNAADRKVGAMKL